MTPILYSLLSVILVSFVSLVGIFFLSLSKHLLDKIVFGLVSLSVGVLLGDVFVHVLPEVYSESISFVHISVAIFSGILVFFVLEKFFRWHHAHTLSEAECVNCDEDKSLDEHTEDEHHNGHIGNMVVFGDGLHNLIDGIVITASFLTSVELGIATTIAVLFHEIPQEISDFGVLLHAGYSRAKAMFYNFLSALVAILGIVIVVYFKDVSGFLVLANAFTAGGFLYIAGSDLVPELHRTTEIKKSFVQLFAIILGFAIMFALTLVE